MGVMLVIKLLLLVEFAALPSCRCYNVVESTSNTIVANNVVYFTIESKRPVIVALISTEGDVDLYASPTGENPTPSGMDYHYSSTSCGLDILLLPLTEEQPKFSLGLFGHIRYDQSAYTLYVVEPSEDDFQRFQIWDWDFEKQAQILLLDADYTVLVNDPVLSEFIQRLSSSTYYGKGQGVGSGKKGQRSFLKDLAELGATVLLKIVEVAIEILAA